MSYYRNAYALGFRELDPLVFQVIAFHLDDAVQFRQSFLPCRPHMRQQVGHKQRTALQAYLRRGQLVTHLL